MFCHLARAMEDTPDPYQKLETLLVLICILKLLWASMHRKKDALRKPFCFVSVFPRMSLCVCVSSVCAL